MFDSIFNHAEQEAPRECCGLIIQDGNDKRYIRMENISEFKDDFKPLNSCQLIYKLTN